jgi:hypothetical protein
LAIFNAAQQVSGSVIINVQAKLVALRKAFDDIATLYAWSSGVSSADLQAIGFSAADAATILSAIADAHAEYLIRTTGQPPGTYPQAASAYVYAASQTQVIGPQLRAHHRMLLPARNSNLLLAVAVGACPSTSVVCRTPTRMASWG